MTKDNFAGFHDFTGFRDSEECNIYGGDAVEYFDDEGGYGKGIVTIDKRNGEYYIRNPQEEKFQTIKSITMLKNFAPRHVRVLK
jgi:hypothetical protein